MRNHPKPLTREGKALKRIIDITGMHCVEDYQTAMASIEDPRWDLEESLVDCYETMWAIAREALIALDIPLHREEQEKT